MLINRKYVDGNIVPDFDEVPEEKRALIKEVTYIYDKDKYFVTFKDKDMLD